MFWFKKLELSLKQQWQRHRAHSFVRNLVVIDYYYGQLNDRDGYLNKLHRHYPREYATVKPYISKFCKSVDVAHSDHSDDTDVTIALDDITDALGI